MARTSHGTHASLRFEGMHLEGPDEGDPRHDAEDDQAGGAGGRRPR